MPRPTTAKRLYPWHLGPVIDPAKVKPIERMTARQRAFADAVFVGTPAAIAYDQAYNTGNMRRTTVWPNATKMLTGCPVIRTRLDQLRSVAGVMVSDEHEARRNLVLTRLEGIATSEATPAATQVKALELLGKVRGTDLFSDRVEQVKGDLTRDQVQQQLADRLAKLGLTEADLAAQAPSKVAKPLALPAPTPSQLVQDAVLVSPEEEEAGG